MPSAGLLSSKRTPATKLWRLMCAALLLMMGCADPAPTRPQTQEPRIPSTTDTLIAIPATGAAVIPRDPPPQFEQATRDSRSLDDKLADASLTTRIQKALYADKPLRGYVFEPRSIGGEVLLKGTVRTPEEQQRALYIAQQTPGTQTVYNDIEVLARPEPPKPEPVLPDLVNQAVSPPANEPTVHRVQPGESLWIIAQQYDLSVAELKRLNNLSSNDLQPGRELRIR